MQFALFLEIAPPGRTEEISRRHPRAPARSQRNLKSDFLTSMPALRVAQISIYNQNWRPGAGFSSHDAPLFEFRTHRMNRSVRAIGLAGCIGNGGDQGINAQ
jgi:hypothetical protein